MSSWTCRSTFFSLFENYSVHAAVRRAKIIDNTERKQRGKEERKENQFENQNSSFFELRRRTAISNFFRIGKKRVQSKRRPCAGARGEVAKIHKEKAEKSERRMPRLLEAKKDVVSCEKLRGSANRK